MFVCRPSRVRQPFYLWSPCCNLSPRTLHLSRHREARQGAMEFNHLQGISLRVTMTGEIDAKHTGIYGYAGRGFQLTFSLD